MGKRGNKTRATSRRTREAAASAQRYLENLSNNGQDITEQERMEMDRAYGSALSDGEFNDDSITVTEQGQLLLAAPKEEPQEPDRIISLRERWTVWIKEDHKLEYPDLSMEVHIVGDGLDDPHIAEWLIRAGCRRADSLMESDIVIFTGGPDVDPLLYHHQPHESVKFSVQRDEDDLSAYMQCYNNGIPMFGICRGAQFLHVMNGGTLYQDIDGHHGEHKMADIINRRVIERVSSVHHQSVMLNMDMKILATASKSESRVKWAPDVEDFVVEVGSKPDIEAFFYPETCCLGVQGHPEYRGYNAYSIWCLEQINKWIIENPDVDFVDNYRRLKPDILGMRDLAQGKEA